MTKRHWKYKPGEQVWYCPTCRRQSAIRITLGHVDFRNQVCRCGRPWNRIARNRLKNWLCLRKEPYTLEKALELKEAVWKTQPAIYHCPFGNHYHLGEAMKDAN